MGGRGLSEGRVELGGEGVTVELCKRRFRFLEGQFVQKHKFVVDIFVLDFLEGQFVRKGEGCRDYSREV